MNAKKVLSDTNSSKSKISTLSEAESNISSKANMYIKSAVRVDIAKG